MKREILSVIIKAAEKSRCMIADYPYWSLLNASQFIAALKEELK